MDEPLTPVLIDGVLHLLTPSQLMHQQSKAEAKRREQQAHDELLAQQLTHRRAAKESTS